MPSSELCQILELAPTSLSIGVQLIFDHFLCTGPALSTMVCRTRFARFTGDAPGSWVLLSEPLAELVGWCLPSERREVGTPPPPQASCTPPLAPASHACLTSSARLYPPACRIPLLSAAPRLSRLHGARGQGGLLPLLFLPPPFTLLFLLLSSMTSVTIRPPPTGASSACSRRRYAHA